MCDLRNYRKQARIIYLGGDGVKKEVLDQPSGLLGFRSLTQYWLNKQQALSLSASTPFSLKWVIAKIRKIMDSNA